MKESTLKNCSSMLEAIGNTPVVKLNKLITPEHADVYVKLEYFNPTGSYKDRMAKTMIEGAEQKGNLKKGMTVVEASGGSTGSSLAFVCAVKGYPFKIISSNAFASEKLKTMAAFGSDLELVHSESGKIGADLIPKMVSRSVEYGEQPDFYLTDQFSNRDALIGYEVIGQEIAEQFPQGVDAFCGAAGVAGMIMGVANVLKNIDRETKIYVLEPASSPMMSKGYPGEHHVEGIGIGFIPPFLDAQLYDEVWDIDESEGREMCRALAEQEGILAGTSTGINVAAALKIAKELGPGKTVVTVACDTGLKYMSGGLFDKVER
ncbi:PLP-dependent cysteine synthase family protein [Larsenimonas salina]|uniref:PLP-dependent cysteine synthase family protein n=1 Tax=Larsenimonas salina TaxID=1295565 RepID=UPI002072B819|nr:cysteine synthase family protein [Larsenimonas salina]MCM5704046.1 cysteine synthase family protein [Larsenimonas salina]